MKFETSYGTPEAVRMIELVEAQRREAWLTSFWGREEARDLLRSFSRCLTYDGEPLAIVGVTPMWFGTAEVWSLLSYKVVEHPIPVIRLNVRYLEHAREVLGFRRAQTYVHPKTEHGLDWLVKYGFEAEGTLRSYIDGDDYLLVAKVWP